MDLAACRQAIMVIGATPSVGGRAGPGQSCKSGGLASVFGVAFFVAEAGDHRPARDFEGGGCVEG